MYPDNFAYFRPRTLAEASALLKKHKNSRVIAGGHSLLPAMKFRLANPKALIDIGGIKGLCGIQTRGKALWIGATTTHAEIAASALVRKSCAVLAEAASQIGDLQVRNRGTIGGSVSHADPAADFPTVLVALGATIVARGPKGERKIAAGDFFLDLFTTALKPGELVAAVLVPPYGKGTGGVYLKHGHPASAYAVVGVAAIVQMKDGVCARASLVVGGATPNPVRAAAAEEALAGRKPDAAAIAAAAGRVAAAITRPAVGLLRLGRVPGAPGDGHGETCPPNGRGTRPGLTGPPGPREVRPTRSTRCRRRSGGATTSPGGASRPRSSSR